MKRWLLAVTALLVTTWGTAQADYIKIIYNLGIAKEQAQDPGQGALGGGGVPGMGMPGGGVPGGGMTMPGAGRPGQSGNPGFGYSGGGGSGSRPGQSGNPGFGYSGGSGGMRPGGGGGDSDAGPAGRGGMTMPGAGGRGGMQPGGRGGMQPGGMPGGMQPGGMPGLGMPGGQPGMHLDEEEEESAPFYVEGVVEIVPKSWKKDGNTRRVQFKHRHGTTNLYIPQDAEYKSTVTTEEFRHREITLIRYKMPTVAQRYDAKYKELLREKDGPTAESLIGLAEWCLQHGKLEEVVKHVAAAAKKDPKNEAVVAFTKMKTAMDKARPAEDDSVLWKDRLGNYKIKQSAHYTLLYDTPSEGLADSRLQRLEETYHGFFYWCGLKKKAVRVPERRMLAVLVDDNDAFKRVHQQLFDGVSMTGDGFYGPRDHVAVFSVKPLSEKYEGLSNVTKTFWSTWSSRKVLLEGKGMKPGMEYETARAQTLTLLLQLQEDDSEVATVSHEGIRQLLALSTFEGSNQPILPSSVEPPVWLQFGIASFFETPAGAFWPGVGAPSWTYLKSFKLKDAAKKLDKPEDALRDTVTDRYFRMVADEKDGKKLQLGLHKARMMSWSLTYFLAQQRREGLLRYFQELAALPRDLEFDGDSLMLAFGRAFDLIDANKPNEVNQTKLYNLAKEWYSIIKYTNLELTQVQNEAIHEQKSEMKSGNKPGGARP